ncbi:hypothetical protein Goklo_017171 [Gossypium klotzschianum]|uniref:RNase H type-1 domain-containing protein n=1 Tax=Gossypium klotzschianum TaxID=34286 RepID=A0A7J8UGK6_9ROSI|nr:hypothetical protein [Gossypium klotzschianum]
MPRSFLFNRTLGRTALSVVRVQKPLSTPLKIVQLLEPFLPSVDLMEEEAQVIWDRAKTLCQDFRIHNLVNKSVLPLTFALKKWEKPPYGTVKINFDAIVFNNKTGFGVIVHDSDGFILSRGGGFKYEDMTAEWAKLYALEEGLKIVCSLNITKAIFKIDCAILVNRVN